MLVGESQVLGWRLDRRPQPKLILSYQLSPFIKRSGEKFLFQHRAQDMENG